MIRLEKLHIKNFKGIEELELSFPEPLMRNDPDVLVLGSKNGVGKTTILEAISLILLVLLGNRELTSYLESTLYRKNLVDLLIRSGEQSAELFGEFHINGNRTASVRLYLSRSSSVDYELDLSSPLIQSIAPEGREQIEKIVYSLLGIHPEPLIFPRLQYFHSHRKVQEGKMDMGMLFDTEEDKNTTTSSRSIDNISSFKVEILKALMSKRGLFENLDTSDSDLTMATLNQLLQEFAGGTIQKLRSNTDGTFEFRVTPQFGGETFSFDGLSSGQKEVISTLFLIWRYTKENAGIILIDEPELHLNAEWHRKFIRHLQKLAPKNQYIIATHSEDVFASVDKDRRLLLVNKNGGEQG